MGSIVIVCYEAKPGQNETLRKLIRSHVPTLRKLGLVTQREPIVMQSQSGIFVEIFEWLSEEASRSAHDDPIVQEMWNRFADACEFRTLNALPESSELFAHFIPG